MKNDYITKAIAKAAVAIEYATWAIEEDNAKDRMHWIKEAMKMLNNSYNWMQKELPF